MASIGRKEIQVRIPVNWIYGIFAIAAALIAGFVFVPVGQRPVLVFAAAVLAGVAAAITAANNIDQRQAAADKATEQARQERITATLAFCDRWNDPAFFTCKRAVRDVRDFIKSSNGDVTAQIAYLKQDPTRLANLIDVLNRFEALNIAIENKVLDDETAKRFFRSIVAEYWHLTEDIIKKLRAEQSSARLYKEFEALYGRWK